MRCPSQPCAIHRSGSDPCERAFANFGGHGKIQGRRRVYNFLEALDGASDMNQIDTWGEDTGDGAQLRYGESCSHLAYNERLHEQPGSQDADMRKYPTDDEEVAAFEKGLHLARVKAVARGMVLKGHLKGTSLTGAQLMQEPWLGEGQLVELRRVELLLPSYPNPSFICILLDTLTITGESHARGR